MGRSRPERVCLQGLAQLLPGPVGVHSDDVVGAERGQRAGGIGQDREVLAGQGTEIVGYEIGHVLPGRGDIARSSASSVARPLRRGSNIGQMPYLSPDLRP